MKLKKPKFWELNKPTFLAYILLPFSIFIKINNFFLNKKIKKVKKDIKTLCVGNIYIGGTGKTPLVIKLYQNLKKINNNISVGKKFYEDQIDEEILLRKKTNLIVDKNRQKIIQRAINENKKILIFDDGLQDRNITYDLEFVCFDAETWIGNGFLIPSGPLREEITSLKKYDAVFLKNSSGENPDIVNSITKINPNINIFHTWYEIKNLKEFDLSDKFLIFSGIGNPNSFKKLLLKNNFNIIDEIIYPDHYKYNDKDIKFIKNQAIKNKAKIVTTAKDFTKIKKIDQNNINYIDIDLIIKNEKNLMNLLEKRINE